jgi:hydroxymethylbilane synthase
VPAPGQGALGLECRTDDTITQSVLTTVNNQITFWAVQAERAFTRALGATCHSPVAALALLDDGELHIRAQLFAEDGSAMIEDKAVFDCGDDACPRELALRMLENAPASIRSLFAPV